MASFLNSAAARQLRQTMDWHLANVADDAELKLRLEGIATQQGFGGMTWHWGPKLWARNRAMFRPFVLQHFAEFALVDGERFATTEPIAWEGEPAKSLDAWLTEVDRADDHVLFRRLYQWKHRDKKGWGLDAARWSADLSQRFAAAGSAAERARVLEKFQMSASLDEAGATRLFDHDPALAKPFILKHLPHRAWRSSEDQRWHRLAARVRERGDEAFALQLHRRLVSAARWRDEVLALAGSTLPADALAAALEQRHPEGLWEDLGPTYRDLLKARGAELLPYVQKHLQDVHSWGQWRDSAMALAELAQARGWVDFRIAVLVKCAQAKHWNAGLSQVLEDRQLDERERQRRLALFSGVSREWNFLGWGLASVQQLEPDLALRLYERHPTLLSTLFKAHVTPAWSHDYAEVFERAWARGDEDLADHLASRYLTRGLWGRRDAKALAPAERVADLLVALKLESAAFARRAAAILTRVPAYAIPDYPRLVRNNRLARLLFERSAQDFLADAGAVRELVEGSEIHVQRLAYRVLGLKDARARQLAADNLELLLGTLLRPLHRDTRRQAFGALKNAAHALEPARVVLARAREAFALPDEHYPKEGLLDLVAHILARHPCLALPSEVSPVYRRAA